MHSTLLEICCYNLQSVKNANAFGADRIELCSDMHSGGVTPSAGFIKAALAVSEIPVYVMIRPRGGDFLYSVGEIEIMMHDISFAKKTGAGGVVFGLLHADGSIDTEQTKRLVEAAYPLPSTFHRAIDMSNDLLNSAELLKATGIQNILTSGGKQKAIDGIETIAKMIEVAGKEISVMAGSGVSAENIPQLFKSGIRNFHASASISGPGNMIFTNKDVKMNAAGDSNEFEITIAHPDKIAAMRQVINTLY